MKLLSTLVSVAGLLSFTSAQLLAYVPPGQTSVQHVSYIFAEPTASQDGATPDNPDFYFQIQGPATKSWIALGQGTGMMNSNMFIVYANAANNNITLSNRLGAGHKMPQAPSGRNLTLLEGSGITNGTMTANIRCRGCNTWNGGSMNFSGAGQPWIYASKDGPPIKSDADSAPIGKHDDGAFGTFSLGLNQMTPDNSSNPFTPESLGRSLILFANGSAGIKPYNGAGIVTHGVIMCLAFIIGFPVGAFLIRLASFSGLVWIHAGVQCLSLLACIIGLGVGAWITTKPGIGIMDFHPIFGIILVVLLIFQPILGYVSHLKYKRFNTPTPWTAVHVWFGRVVVTGGLINGFLGLMLAGQSVGTKVAYGIVAGIVWSLWIVVMALAGKKEKNQKVFNNNIRMAALVDERNKNEYGGA